MAFDFELHNFVPVLLSLAAFEVNRAHCCTFAQKMNPKVFDGNTNDLRIML